MTAFSDLEKKSDEELRELLCAKQDEIRRLRFKAKENQLSDVSKIKKIKKEIAQIQTLLTRSKDSQEQ